MPTYAVAASKELAARAIPLFKSLNDPKIAIPSSQQKFSLHDLNGPIILVVELSEQGYEDFEKEFPREHLNIQKDHVVLIGIPPSSSQSKEILPDNFAHAAGISHLQENFNYFRYDPKKPDNTQQIKNAVIRAENRLIEEPLIQISEVKKIVNEETARLREKAGITTKKMKTKADEIEKALARAILKFGNAEYVDLNQFFTHKEPLTYEQDGREGKITHKKGDLILKNGKPVLGLSIQEAIEKPRWHSKSPRFEVVKKKVVKHLKESTFKSLGLQVDLDYLKQIITEEVDILKKKKSLLSRHVQDKVDAITQAFGIMEKHCIRTKQNALSIKDVYEYLEDYKVKEALEMKRGYSKSKMYENICDRLEEHLQKKIQSTFDQREKPVSDEPKPEEDASSSGLSRSS